eukprot:3113902-Amphidinium_carterae.1
MNRYIKRRTQQTRQELRGRACWVCVPTLLFEEQTGHARRTLNAGGTEALCIDSIACKSNLLPRTLSSVIPI